MFKAKNSIPIVSNDKDNYEKKYFKDKSDFLMKDRKKQVENYKKFDKIYAKNQDNIRIRDRRSTH